MPLHNSIFSDPDAVAEIFAGRNKSSIWVVRGGNSVFSPNITRNGIIYDDNDDSKVDIITEEKENIFEKEQLQILEKNQGKGVIIF